MIDPVRKFLINLNSYPDSDPALPLLIIYPTEIKIYVHKKYENIHSCFIHKSPKLKTIEICQQENEETRDTSAIKRNKLIMWLQRWRLGVGGVVGTDSGIFQNKNSGVT